MPQTLSLEMSTAVAAVRRAAAPARGPAPVLPGARAGGRARGASRDEGRRERFAARSGAETYADWRELLAAEPLDIVSIATYTPVHEEITLACIEAGVKAIYCEKPVAPTVAAGERMVAACAEAGSLLVFNHQRRFTSNLRRLRDHIKTGGLGDLISVNTRSKSFKVIPEQGNCVVSLVLSQCTSEDDKALFL